MALKEIRAAAERFTHKIFRNPDRSLDESATRARQAKAYEYWDDTPEVRFSAIWVGRAMGRSRLYAGLRTRDGEIEEAPEDHAAWQAVNRMAGGPTGQSQFLELCGPHLVVAGEAYAIIVPRVNEFEEITGEDWHVVAPIKTKDLTNGGEKWLEVSVAGEKLVVPPASHAFSTKAEEEAAPMAVRIWNPHPVEFRMADSPVMSSFIILDELRLLNASIAASAKSRLVGRGIFGYPAGSSLPGGETDIGAAMMIVAGTAYGDPSSAAATLPVFVEVPKGEKFDQSNLIKFESHFDELSIRLREEQIRRYATSSDTPAEVLLGTEGINHWGVWALQDEAIRVGVEPRLATVCDALTTQWLWPLLDSDEAVVWYDTSGLRVRTNRSQTAMELGARNVISSKAERRETGFEDEDAPGPNSVRLRTLIMAAEAIPDADPSRAEVSKRIVALLDQVLDEAVEFNSSGEPVGELPVDETQAPPEEPSSTEPILDTGPADILSAAVDSVVVRALERAGHRILRARGRGAREGVTDLAASAVHTRETPGPTELQGLNLLAGAWSRVSEIAERYDVNAQCLTDVLDEYTKNLLLSGTEHKFEMIPLLIRQATCLQLA